MLKLIVFNPAFGAPSASPFCTKAMCLLKMTGVEHRVVYGGDSRKAPKQKLPVLMDQDRAIPDSDAIRAHLETVAGIDFDAGLDPKQRATSRAVIRMVEEHLYFAIIYDRWLNDENWPHVRKVFFAPLPAPLRGIISRLVRKKVRTQVMGQGMGRHSPQEQLARVDADLTAISALLDGQDFLFGNSPTGADASVAPMLEAIAAAPAETALKRRVSQDPVLMDYLARARGVIYPDA